MNEHDEVSKYINAYPDDSGNILLTLRTLLKENFPHAKEKISWQMPTFYIDKRVFHFAGFKHHLGIYPGPDAILFFKDKLMSYKTSKGAIRFSYHEPIPYPLIIDIAHWCLEKADK